MFFHFLLLITCRSFARLTAFYGGWNVSFFYRDWNDIWFKRKVVSCDWFRDPNVFNPFSKCIFHACSYSFVADSSSVSLMYPQCIFNALFLHRRCQSIKYFPFFYGLEVILCIAFCFRSTSVSSMYLRCNGSFHISKHCQFIKDFSFFYGLVLPKRESFMNNKALLLFRSWCLCWNQKRTGKNPSIEISSWKKS